MIGKKWPARRVIERETTRRDGLLCHFGKIRTVFVYAGYRGVQRYGVVRGFQQEQAAGALPVRPHRRIGRRDRIRV